MRIEDMMRSGSGTSIGRCNECRREYPRVEPDAKFKCKSKDCNGTVKSKEVRNGFM